jgi:tetratricopeptide (TPR) repeat protein
MRAARTFAFWTASLAIACSAGAHEHAAESAPPPTRLGKVAFETSCSPATRPEFNRAVALLHSFWLDEATRAFRRVQSADPQCAMAYWGEAFAGLHFLNGEPSPEEASASAAALAKARNARKRTAREREWIDALQTFLDDYSPARYVDNANRYSDAMLALSERHPDDLEARVLAAFTLLTWRRPGDVTLDNARHSVDMLAPLMRVHPDHPGIAHYIIHATDSPQMANAGLDAARRYATIAPAAPHALHMPSHIFTRLGIWRDDIQSNLASKAAAEDARLHVGAENRLHAMEFLLYAYLQTAQYGKAEAIATEGRTVRAADVNPAYPGYHPLVMARFDFLLAVEQQDWERAKSLRPPETGNAYVKGLALLAHAMAAGHRRDVDAALDATADYSRLIAREPRVWPDSPFETLGDEIAAWASFASGNRDAAVARLRPIAERQEKQGKGEIDLPAREMIADMLLLEEQWAPAFDEFTASLRSDPNRFTALLGAATAAEKLGRRDDAVRLYRNLLDTCADADAAGRRRLEHARAVVDAAPR